MEYNIIMEYLPTLFTTIKQIPHLFKNEPNHSKNIYYLDAKKTWFPESMRKREAAIWITNDDVQTDNAKIFIVMPINTCLLSFKTN